MMYLQDLFHGFIPIKIIIPKFKHGVYVKNQHYVVAREHNVDQVKS